MKYFISFFLLIFACHACAAGSIFSVEMISREDYEAAKSVCNGDTASFLNEKAQINPVVRRVLADVRKRFERLPVDEREMVDYALSYETMAEDYERFMSVESLYVRKDLGIYCFLLPYPHEYVLYCYDMESGKFYGEMKCPFTVSPDGKIMVAQTGLDCDNCMDLHFYSLNKKYNIWFQNYMRHDISPDIYGYSADDNGPCSFWSGNDTLYIKTYKRAADDLIYLKLTVEGRMND